MDNDDIFRNGYSNLQAFVLSEIRRRQISAREFADLVGVTHATINKCVNAAAGNPSIELLLRLSKATETDLMSIIALAFPAIANQTRPDPEAFILAQRFSQLPEDIRNFLKATVLK